MSEYHYAVMAALPGFAPRLAADEPRRVLLWAHADRTAARSTRPSGTPRRMSVRRRVTSQGLQGSGEVCSGAETPG